MTTQRKNFTGHFTENKLPNWKCPICKDGYLQKEKIKSFEASSSREERKESSELGFGTFVGLLRCANTNCKEPTIVSGYMYNIYAEELTPSYFNPPIHLFDINKGVPKEIRDEIINAFKLYWLDISACANKIRIALEEIMTHENIERECAKCGNKPSLHQRIKRFRKYISKRMTTEETDLLNALKWIGNEGSHSGNNLTQENILDGFDMLEFITRKLYSKEKAEIIEKSKKYLMPKNGQNQD